jgi:hypothetical protein
MTAERDGTLRLYTLHKPKILNVNDLEVDTDNVFRRMVVTSGKKYSTTLKEQLQTSIMGSDTMNRSEELQEELPFLDFFPRSGLFIQRVQSIPLSMFKAHTKFQNRPNEGDQNEEKNDIVHNILRMYHLKRRDCYDEDEGLYHLLIKCKCLIYNSF